MGLRMKQDCKYTIGVIGTGVTGKGLVELAIRSGCKVIFKSRSVDSLDNALKIISGKLSKDMSPEEVKMALDRLELTTNYESLSGANIIIESVIEDLHIKRDVFQILESVCETDVILASNTSSLLISEISNCLCYPERTAGLHFFNPITKMKLVEIIKGEKTSESVIEKCHELALKLGKTPVIVNDSTGFIVNRLLFTMINEACHMLEEGVASVEEIDTAIKLGARHPMGPFELADFIGLDLCLEILGNLNTMPIEKKYKANDLLENLINNGHCGRKSQKGFYTYGTNVFK